MKIIKIWFDSDYIYGIDESGNEYRQSLLWYPKLRTATDEQRAEYTFGMGGIHWRALDEDISFESFTYDDAEPSPMQRFFLTYINGFKKPSAERQQAILNHIHKLGQELTAACF